METEVKRIIGHGGGTNLEWMCIRHVSGYGFGNEPAITCVDMTVHAPEQDKPNVVLSTYEMKGREQISPDVVRRHFNRDAYQTWEQVEFARRIVTGWDKIKSGEKIELDYAQPTEEKPFFRRR